MSQIFIQLRTDTRRSFAGHQVSVFFTQIVQLEDSDPIQVAGKATASSDSSGRATLELPDKKNLVRESPILIYVISPDGQTLRETSVSIEQIDGEPIEIKVDPKEFFPIEPNTDPAFGKPSKIRGLVVDPSGQHDVSNLQVILSAKSAEREEAKWEIVAVSQTDLKGYFSAPYPLGKYSEAQGVVSAGRKLQVPIRLKEDGTFPEQVILGVELSQTATNGSDGFVPRDPDNQDLVNSPITYTEDLGGHCVDLTKPNRVLEEFDYYTVVRTTEPSIQGLTVKEPPKIELNEVLKIINPKILNLALLTQAQTTASTLNPSTAANITGITIAQPLAAYGFNLINPELFSSQVIAEARPELDDLSEAISLTSLRVAQAQTTALAENENNPRPDIADDVAIQNVKLEAELVKTLTRDPDGFSLTRLANAELITRKHDLVRLLELIKRVASGRGNLSCDNAVDWDDEPTFYQACTIAHGHILHLKQQWVADGYSLGDLLYSLPLAPCQKKQIAIIDWDRRESAARLESLQEQEFLAAQLSRDRDISEIANASVRESLTGGSEASTSSFGGGLGIGAIIVPVGGLLGIGGGTSGASSSAWQNSSRNASASSLQQLRDQVSQSASAVRSQRSTVIQTAQQGENVQVQTEVVANHNHCHAITIQYFEVLRHFLVRHHLADVQECLLVPLLMSRFDSAKARRWREPLSRYLRDRRLQRGFDALQRIADNYVGSDLPTGSYAEEELVYLDGYFRIQFRIQRPRDDDEGAFLPAAWSVFDWLGITPREFWRNYLENQQERDRIFAEILGPRIAEEITNGLRIYAVDDADNEIRLPIDLTLISDFQNDRPLYVSLRLNADLPSLRRDRIKFIKIDTTVDTNAGARNIDDILPTGSKVIVHSGQMGYRTDYLAHDLFRQSRILNDLSGTDGVLVFTPLSRQELKNPREEDKEYANTLLKHLNDHLEFNHRVIWLMGIDRQRLYMLLDGFIAPNSGGRSVASVVENRPVGIIGNCLVMPVARGFHLDPTFEQDEDNPIDLLQHYQPTTPIAPQRIALPTKGVFAESVMGACNSCEKIDESRFWRWEESPCPDDPTPIQPISTQSRRAEPPNLEAKDFPSPIVAFQNVPNAPEPQGFGALLQLLANTNFRDITGLTENQRNALAGLQAALGTAQFFGGKAADLALQGNMRQDIDKALDKINEQHQAGAINDQQRAQLTESALRSMIGAGTSSPTQPITTEEVEQVTRTAGAEDASVNLSRQPGSESLSVDAQPQFASQQQPLQQRCGFFGSNNVVSEADLREEVRLAAVEERQNWLDSSGNLLRENENSQFGLLVSYWLSRFSAIRPTTLSALQANALSTTINYGNLLNAGASDATVAAEIARVRSDLLVAAPDTGSPANLNRLIGEALQNARKSRQINLAWSGVFIVSCIREAAIDLDLEAMFNGTYIGRDGLLRANGGHRVYVEEAYKRRFGPGQRDGTYHAFRPDERSVQVGDIIALDRQANRIEVVEDFDDIPGITLRGRQMHCDIVVDVNSASNSLVAIGGNLGNSVRRRRYPLNADGTLVVAEAQLFTQETDTGTLDNVPLVNPGGNFSDHSTGRIFALLSPVEDCATVPGQPMGGGTLV